MADLQAERLYAAENSTRCFSDPRCYLGTMSATANFLGEVVRAEWFRERWPTMEDVRIRLLDGRGCQSGWARADGTISLPTWARRKLVVLHELAHVVTWQHYGLDQPAHGRKFAWVYLELVRRVLGKEAARELRRAFRVQGVRCRRRK